jgi:hypothetical protein
VNAGMLRSDCQRPTTAREKSGLSEMISAVG